MKPKLYLHVGSHKTGTTAIQEVLYTNRAELQKHGLLYPTSYISKNSLPKGHHKIFKAINGDRKAQLKKPLSNLVNDWLDKAKKQSLDIVLSAEPIFRLKAGSSGGEMEKRAQYLKKVKDVFQGFEIVPVVVYRQPESFISSLYSEQIASGALRYRKTLTEFTSSAAIKSLLDYRGFADLLETVFGQVKVLSYEDLCNSKAGLVDEFVRQLFPISLPINLVQPNKRVRASLSVKEIRLKEFLNSFYENRERRRKIKDQLTNSDVLHKLTDKLFPEENYTLWSPGEQQQVLSEFVDTHRYWESITENSPAEPHKGKEKTFCPAVDAAMFFDALLDLKLNTNEASN
jgi:hypothetical protein